MKNEIKYPKIKVKLSGTDGNVFALAGLVTSAMKKHKVEQSIISEFSSALFKCKSYDEALQLMASYVNVR